MDEKRFGYTIHMPPAIKMVLWVFLSALGVLLAYLAGSSWYFGWPVIPNQTPSISRASAGDQSPVYFVIRGRMKKALAHDGSSLTGAITIDGDQRKTPVTIEMKPGDRSLGIIYFQKTFDEDTDGVQGSDRAFLSSMMRGARVLLYINTGLPSDPSPTRDILQAASGGSLWALKGATLSPYMVGVIGTPPSPR